MPEDHQTIGPYTVVATLGEGGMGQVYRAHDPRLDRDVAIKIMPAALAQDVDRRSRFDREARTLASLNHPNIAHLLGVEEADGRIALVMELVDGDTLADVIARGPMPVRDVVTVARQIAAGLECAHDAGIIHRDLKPANVKVRADGAVKLLDFGLAKAIAQHPNDAGSREVTSSPTIATHGTQPGIILGTVRYMSPEQARGLLIDARADLWALGAVIYEMLVGKPLFEGENTSDILAAVLREEVSLEALPANTPERLRTLIARCLQRDVQMRLRHAGDARIELMDTDASGTMLRREATGPAQSRRVPYAIAGATLVAVALAGVTFLPGVPFGPPAASRLLKWTIPLEAPIDTWEAASPPALSPDGRHVAYIDDNHLRIRDLASLDARIVDIAGTAIAPVWSPDSTEVAFSIDHKTLWRVPAAGGVPIRICDLPPGLVFGAAWQSSGAIIINKVYGPDAGELFTVPAAGGTPQPRPAAPEAAGVFFLHGLPGDVLVYSGGRGKMIIEGVGTRPRELAMVPSQSVAYSPSGHLIYTPQRGGGVWAMPFELGTLEQTGEPFRIAPDGAGVSASTNGLLAYGLAVDGLAQLTWVDRDGLARGAIGQPQQDMNNVALSPDGARVAVDGRESGEVSIWVHEVDRPVKTRVTSGAADGEPAWQGSLPRLTFARNFDLLGVGSSGGEPEKVVVNGKALYNPTWSRDGRVMLYGQYESTTRSDIWMLDASTGQSKLLLQTPGDEYHARISPDGRHFAYASDETGSFQVFVRAFPSGEGRIQVSVDGGVMPQWSPKGDEIFYVKDRVVMAAPIRVTPELRVQVARKLFDLDLAGLSRTRSNSVAPFATPDGQRFIVVRTLRPARGGVALVQDWFAEFRK